MNNGRPGLALRADRSDAVLERIERDAIAMFATISASSAQGPWDPSPVEDRHQKLREALVTSPGILRRFRRTFLAAGRLNFPDSPRPKEYFLEWDDRLAGQRRSGAVHLARMMLRLYRRQPFALRELNDNLIGAPTPTFRLPASRQHVVAALLRRLRLQWVLRDPDVRSDAYITEVQLRSVYYRKRVQSILGSAPAQILEIGGGYGALAAEILQTLPVQRYFMVELPESVPLAHFYLSACFECRIQVLTRPTDVVDPDARIVILPPWALPAIAGPIDLLVNTHSFQHMLAESIAFYLQQSDRLRARFLYLVNRDRKRDPTDVPISQYPIPSCYRVMDRREWVFGPTPEIVYQSDRP